ncbi:TPA: hypothetical protein ACU6E5_004299 [Pseudomonas aeruginosa]
MQFTAKLVMKLIGYLLLDASLDQGRCSFYVLDEDGLGGSDLEFVVDLLAIVRALGNEPVLVDVESDSPILLRTACAMQIVGVEGWFSLERAAVLVLQHVHIVLQVEGERRLPACCGQVRSFCGDDASPDRAGCQDEEVQQAAEKAA